MKVLLMSLALLGISGCTLAGNLSPTVGAIDKVAEGYVDATVDGFIEQSCAGPADVVSRATDRHPALVPFLLEECDETWGKFARQARAYELRPLQLPRTSGD